MAEGSSLTLAEIEAKYADLFPERVDISDPGWREAKEKEIWPETLGPASLLDLLKGIEWIPPLWYCPYCRGHKNTGHRWPCKLERSIRLLEKQIAAGD